jgi:hypothetical protein
MSKTCTGKCAESVNGKSTTNTTLEYRTLFNSDMFFRSCAECEFSEAKKCKECGCDKHLRCSELDIDVDASFYCKKWRPKEGRATVRTWVW